MESLILTNAVEIKEQELTPMIKHLGVHANLCAWLMRSYRKTRSDLMELLSSDKLPRVKAGLLIIGRAIDREMGPSGGLPPAFT
jgi:hypothetical protein